MAFFKYILGFFYDAVDQYGKEAGNHPGEGAIWGKHPINKKGLGRLDRK